jgi:hypothetical protein
MTDQMIPKPQEMILFFFKVVVYQLI